MAAESVPRRIPPFASSGMQTLCRPFVDELPVDGASISVFSLTGQSTICVSDALAARSEALQFELGEGPHWEALHTGVPVLLPDLAGDASSQWPIFRDAARTIGINALFAFPMKMGAAIVGVVDLYARRAITMNATTISRAAAMAARAAPAAAHQAMNSANDHRSDEDQMAPAMRREVHQATGMIQAQLDTSATDAFARLRAHAFATGLSVDDIARDVVERRLDFSTLPD